MSFLKNVLAALLGIILFFTFLFFILIGIGSAASSSSPVSIKDNSVLHLKFNESIAERSINDPFAEVFMDGAVPMGLIELREAIAQAKDDEKIKGIFLEQGLASTGMAKMQELRKSLEGFKESGKFVVSYGEFIPEGQYFLASVADEVYLNPMGSFELNGLNATLTFFKGTLDKLGIKAQVFRPESNKYKGAVEPYIRTNMSEESRAQITSLLGDIQDQYLSTVATNIDVSKQELGNIAKSMLARDAGDALSYKLVSDTLYYDQVLEVLEGKMNLEEGDDLNLVDLSDYRNSYKIKHESRDRVAVIVATGPIISGKGDEDTIGSDKFAEEIRKARLNDKVKAVVLRVNSPGGSALASDVIWREVVLTKKVKPVIASMSDVAASGGYYISMACDTIVADPMTITGSIGIFGMIPDMSEFLTEKLGITSDRVSTGDLADLYTVSRPLSDFEKSVIQKSIDDGYENFTGKAAQGRGMTKEAVKEVGGGRVWTGAQAKELGLVDVLGGLDDAVAIAAEKAGLEEYRLSYYPKQKELLEQILEDFGGGAQTKILERELGEYYKYVEEIKKIKSMEGAQMRMPYEIVID